VYRSFPGSAKKEKNFRNWKPFLERRGEASLLEKAVREAAAGVISLEEACKFREVGSTVSLE
jgi:hypothetical protein